MKLSYRQRLFLYFGVLFTLFTIGIIIFEQAREKSYKTQALEEKLEAYTDIIQAKISEDKDSIVPEITSLQTILPKELRITLISNNGIVIYDNSINDYAHLSNHKNRPEIIGANNIGKSSDIRLSQSNQHEYLYFAKKSDNLFIRVALPYNIKLQQFLKPDNASLYYMPSFCSSFISLQIDLEKP